MLCFKGFEEILRGASASIFYIGETLADSLLRAPSRGDIQQSLIGFRVLHDGSRLTLHCENDGPLAALDLLHEIAGAAAEGRERMNIFGNVKHASHLEAPF